MDLLTHNRQMAANNRWSNDRLYRAVLYLKPGEFKAPRTGFFPSIKQTLNHILAVDHYYLDAMEEAGGGADVYDGFPAFDDPSRLAKAQEDFDLSLMAFCAGLSLSNLDRPVVTDRREDGKVPERIGSLLTHLFVHQVHHRGQVHAMLSGTSVKPPQLDEFFLDYDEPVRREEVARLGLGGLKGDF